MFVFTEPIGIRRFGERYGAKNSARAKVSVGSPTGVPVPKLKKRDSNTQFQMKIKKSLRIS